MGPNHNDQIVSSGEFKVSMTKRLANQALDAVAFWSRSHAAGDADPHAKMAEIVGQRVDSQRAA